ncbi:MAG: hypothetical protein QXY75_04965 [Candidatus Bathyarchaeia archaeon]
MSRLSPIHYILSIPAAPYFLEDEIAVPEDYKKYFEDKKAGIEREIKDVGT